MDRLKDLKVKLKQIVDDHKLKIIIGLFAVIGCLMVALFIALGQHNDNQEMASPANANTSLQSRHESNSKPSGQFNRSRYQSTFIDIEGAVKRPGVYQFTNNMRIDDAVNLAGGLNRSADRKHINLAKKLEDQQTVYIPVKGEIKGLPAGGNNQTSDSDGSSDSKAGSMGSGKVNLNSADDKQLESISGIGEKRAQKIVEYKKSHGDFKQLSDLKNVSGIGDKFLSNIKDHVTV